MLKFEWDADKDAANQKKHGISFEEAQQAFADPNRVVVEDKKHSNVESRLFCYGKIGDEVVTVRFTIRKGRIRIYGAAYWREGKKAYEKENQV